MPRNFMEYIFTCRQVVEQARHPVISLNISFDSPSPVPSAYSMSVRKTDGTIEVEGSTIRAVIVILFLLAMSVLSSAKRDIYGDSFNCVVFLHLAHR